MLNQEERQRGIIAASLGNHAQAVCYHGYKLGIPVTVVMPLIAPIMKIQKCREYHATVVIEGKVNCQTIQMSLSYNNCTYTGCHIFFK